MVTKTNSIDESEAEIARMEALKKRAARQAAKRELAPSVFPQVECTVLPAGHDKISTGVHIGGLGDAYYEEGETFTADLPIALALYRRNYVNFDGARQALDDEKKRIVEEERETRAEKMAMQAALERAGL